MARYVVTWTIDIEADGPAEAAEQAFGIMQDGESTATVFTVEGEGGGRHEVDLRFEDRRAAVKDLATGDVSYRPL